MGSAKPKCELCPLICVCEDVDLNRKAVKHGQAARQCSLDPKQDVGLRRSTRQHTLDSSQTTLQPKDQMLKQATRFLDKASEQMCRVSEEPVHSKQCPLLFYVHGLQEQNSLLFSSQQ